MFARECQRSSFEHLGESGTGIGILYYTVAMAIRKPKQHRQPQMWVAVTDLATAVSHSFCRRLNQFLREHGLGDSTEAQCAS